MFISCMVAWLLILALYIYSVYLQGYVFANALPVINHNTIRFGKHAFCDTYLYPR